MNVRLGLRAALATCAAAGVMAGCGDSSGKTENERYEDRVEALARAQGAPAPSGQALRSYQADLQALPAPAALRSQRDALVETTRVTQRLQKRAGAIVDEVFKGGRKALPGAQAQMSTISLAVGINAEEADKLRSGIRAQGGSLGASVERLRGRYRKAQLRTVAQGRDRLLALARGLRATKPPASVAGPHRRLVGALEDVADLTTTFARAQQDDAAKQFPEVARRYLLEAARVRDLQVQIFSKTG